MTPAVIAEARRRALHDTAQMRPVDLAALMLDCPRWSYHEDPERAPLLVFEVEVGEVTVRIPTPPKAMEDAARFLAAAVIYTSTPRDPWGG